MKTYHRLLKDQIQITGMEMLHSFRYSPFELEQQFKILSINDQYVKIEWQVYFGLHQVVLKDLQKMLLENSNTTLLPDGSIAVFTDAWVQQFGMLIRHAQILNTQHVLVPVWLCIGNIDLQASQPLQAVLPTDWNAQWQSWQNEEAAIFPKPQSFKGDLRSYQQKGFEWMCLLAAIKGGGILSDDMGLGKTIQAICFLLHQTNQYPGVQQLIICPSSLVYNWMEELQKFAPSLKVLMYQGNTRSENELKYHHKNYDIVLSTYGTIRADIELFQNIIWNAVILDECHHIKNIQSQTAKAVYSIHAACRFGLSGTPILNTTLDLFAQFKFFLPELLGNADFFKKQYAEPIDKFGNQDQMQALKKVTAPFILKRNKTEVAKDLPEKTEAIIWCTMPDAQQDAYNELKSQVRANILTGVKEVGIGATTLSILAGISKLKQFCAAPQLVENTKHLKESIKIQMLVDELMQLGPDNKALVFSQYKGVLNIISKQLKAHNIDFYHFDGDTKVNERASIVQSFQTPGSTTNILLMTLKTGNAGLNLTQADYVFLVDPWWNTAVENQAIDRAHRIGQTKHVFAYRMICKDSIEEKIINIQNKKKTISEQVLDYEEGFVKQLSEADIAYLFE